MSWFMLAWLTAVRASSTVREPSWASMGCTSTSSAEHAPGGSARAKPATRTPEWTFTGFSDLYYQYKFQQAVDSAVTGRQYDVRRNTLGMSVTEVNASRQPRPHSRFGMTVTAVVGPNADINTATDPGGRSGSMKLFQQLYATYDSFGREPVTIDFGKFATWIGYEGIESRGNDNYSRSFLWTFAQPTYHLGMRIAAPLTRRLSGTVYLVNGWNDVVDGNGAGSYGATVTFQPAPSWSISLNGYSGEEGSIRRNGVGSYGGIGFPTPGIRHVNLADLYATWNTTAKLKLAVDGTYASAAGANVPGGHWNGEDFYARYQVTPVIAAALRMDRFEDTNGLRTGLAANFASLTANIDYLAWRGHVLVRLEYRHDHASRSFFAGGATSSKDQDTVLLATALSL